jgi:putative acetyltransferase
MPDASPLRIRTIEARDDATIAAIIRSVMPEFGADGPGFAIHDAEVDAMSAAYAGPRSAYLVWEQGGLLLGGGGIAPLAGAGAEVCELRKMYFLPAARGRGWGEVLLRRLLSEARAREFRTCYLETLTGMEAAQRLYRRMGFVRLDGPLGRTGHHGCNRWYARDLAARRAGDGDL